MGDKVKPVCNYCGSDDISADATAHWNTNKQEWELTDVFAKYYCGNCEGDSFVVFKPAKVSKVCAKCGSDNVVGSANMCWNTEKQEWEAQDLHDEFFCNECNENCEVIDGNVC